MMDSNLPPTRMINNKPPIDKIEAPIIACNDNFPTSRVRRPSTPSSRARPPSAPLNGEGGNTLPRKGREDKKQRGSRIRSASAGRDHKSEMCSRYWTYLFENLERSISEIYEGCEKEENIIRCKEVVLILENYTRDFTKLIEWFHLKWNYEKTPPPMRPQALAWEIRKPTLCLLPHTRAYEKLLGLKESGPTPLVKTRNQNTKDELNPIGSEMCADVNVNQEICDPPLATNTISNSINGPKTVDVCLQVDIEEPDVYYFAGGRSVASITDYSDQYPPLTPICFKTMPAILVLNSDSDLETSTTSAVPNDSVTTSTEFSGQLTSSNEDAECFSSVTTTSRDFVPTNNPSDIGGGITVSSDNPPSAIEAVVRPSTPSETVETKSSGTQLSGGVFIADEALIEKDQDKGKNKDAEGGKGDCPTPTKTTFAEKAKNGLLRQNQNQAKSVPGSLNKVGTVTNAILVKTTRDIRTTSLRSVNANVRPTSSAGLKSSMKPRTTISAAVIPNYRSNIASRCRAAMNTGGQTIQMDSTTPSLAKSPKDKTNKTSPPQQVSSSTSSSSFSTSAKPLSKALTSNTSTKDSVPLDKQQQKQHSNSKEDGSPSHSGLLVDKQQSFAVPNSRGPPFSCPGAVGITRSKSLINPLPSRKTSLRDANPQRMKEQGGIGSSTVSLKSSSSFRRLQSNSYISLPDETSCKKKSVDAEGWETVKARSSRGRWSSSNSSLGSPNATQLNTSVDKRTSQLQGTTAPTPKTANKTQSNQKKSSPPKENKSNAKMSKDSSTVNAKPNQQNPKKKSQPSKSSSDGSEKSSSKNEDSSTPNTVVAVSEASQNEDESTDDEEIKRKEADLDYAIRQEELLEEELRQVEKDFERIENDSTTEEGTITDSEHAQSPEVVDPDEETDDQRFIISIDDQDIDRVEDLPPREPGRILSLREKLMSPSRKLDRDGAETLKKHRAKLAKAERNREKLLQAKFNRYVELSDRFEALNETTEKLVAERAELILKAEERRKRAVEKRQEYLKNIQRKAHDEESKLKEIAFINLLEAQNKRHDYFASAQGIEERLQKMQDERRLTLEERAGKAAAVISRQSLIKKDWQLKLQSLQEKRRKKDERITREKEERAKERSEMAQEKARDREERLSALQAAQEAEKEELKKKIKIKQEETARRHEENMEQIRQKAIELGAPRVQEENAVPSICRVCTLCNVMIQSGIHEMQHIRSRQHLECVKKAEKSGCDNPNNKVATGLVEGFGLKYIADVQADKVDPKVQPDKNRNKAQKKHSKKLMQKLMESGLEFENAEKTSKSHTVNCVDTHLRNKIRKNILELERLVGVFSNGKGSTASGTAMDRIMAEIRKASIQNMYVKDAMISMNGFEVAFKVLQCSASDLPLRTRIHATEMLHGFILGNLSNALYILRGTGICTLMNTCAERWDVLITDDNRWLCGSSQAVNDNLPTDPCIESIIALLFNVLEYLPDPFHGIMKRGTFLTQAEIQSIKNRTFDIIRYIIASGVVDRISVYCGGVRGAVDSHPAVANILRIFVDFLVLLVYTLQFCWGENPASCILQKKEPDPTQLLAALEASELAGTVSMSYSLLLHQGAPTRPRSTDGVSSTSNPPPPGNATSEVIKSTLCLINAMARLDLLALQNVLASEAVSLQFRHIASQLLWQVVPHRHCPLMRRLLTELIISIGNFTVGNKHNQAVIQSGQTPTVLQLLCTLPEEYFSDPKLRHNFIPTLLAATQGCPENRDILVQNNVDLKILDDYLESDEGKKNVVVKRLLHVTSSNIQLNSSNKGKNNKGKPPQGCKPKPLEETSNIIKEEVVTTHVAPNAGSTS